VYLPLLISMGDGAGGYLDFLAGAIPDNHELLLHGIIGWGYGSPLPYSQSPLVVK
jgi:hypothetical protein